MKKKQSRKRVPHAGWESHWPVRRPAAAVRDTLRRCCCRDGPLAPFAQRRRRRPRSKLPSVLPRRRQPRGFLPALSVVTKFTHGMRLPVRFAIEIGLAFGSFGAAQLALAGELWARRLRAPGNAGEMRGRCSRFLFFTLP